MTVVHACDLLMAFDLDSMNTLKRLNPISSCVILGVEWHRMPNMPRVATKAIVFAPEHGARTWP